MKGRGVKAPASSIRARLLALARADGDDFQRLLIRYGIERLLFRLSQTEAGELYVLKGAMLFAAWPGHILRPTGDLDLLGRGDPNTEKLRDTFTRICQVELPDDGIRFDPSALQVAEVREAGKYRGARLTLKADLAGAVISVLIDIGFGDYVYPPPLQATFPSLLPDLPQARILMYPPETVIAEKFEAMIRFGATNTRIKDFYDIWVITRTFRFDLASVVEAVGGTLRRRETAIPAAIPIGLTDAFAAIAADRGLWSGFLRRSPPAMPPPSFPQVQDHLRRFFGPVIASLSLPEGARGAWDPHTITWH